MEKDLQILPLESADRAASTWTRCKDDDEPTGRDEMRRGATEEGEGDVGDGDREEAICFRRGERLFVRVNVGLLWFQRKVIKEWNDHSSASLVK